MTLIFNTPVTGPATHALVIGVGRYTHLPGGKGGKIFPNHGGLGQLSSPPHSARLFANWLLSDYCNDTQPLATVDVLISDSKVKEFTDQTGKIFQIERASFANVEKAILDRWVERGNTNPDNLMIFFFCGHGVSRGLKTSLLMEDFGSLENNPLREGIDFEAFFGGMDKCKARNQVYFIDSCRAASANLILEYNDYTGEPILPMAPGYSGPRSCARYYAAVPGQKAYGRDSQPSVFTEALLKAMQGAGCSGYTSRWKVNTDTLGQGLRVLIRRSQQELQTQAQISDYIDASFPLHLLKTEPIIPITLGCMPTEANLVAEMGYVYKDGQRQTRPVPDASDWDLMIPPGDYNFFAEFNAGIYKNNNIHVYVNPPGQPLPLEVKP